IMCLEEGILQTYLDAELDVQQAGDVAAHLAECAACRERLRSLAELANCTAVSLTSYMQATAAISRPEHVIPMSYLRHRQASQNKQRRLISMMQKYRWLTGVSAAVLALALILSSPPGRSLAAQFLNIFRMERIQLVEITSADMLELGQLLDNFHGEGGTVDIRNFGRVQVTVPTAADWRVEADPSQVEGLSGVKLNLPATLAGQTRTEIIVEQAPTITFTPDVENLNNYLRRNSAVVLPQALAGQSVIFNIPPVIRAQYFGPTGQGFAIYAARDLTIEAPPGVDIAYLRQALVRVPFLPENFRRQLADIHDWRQTLPIPALPGMSWTDTTVNGSPAVYFMNEVDRTVVLAWREGGSWRAISGLSLEAALSIAGEIR
ncbi:MAG: zf-HC2 domain-containing protein, partial [Selenomonadales bacterium]|nr:zf-HC2 domain-containing protein [Selenomonadales bacterium]